jgi:hypothetical protein
MQGLQSLLTQSSHNDLDSIKQLHVYLNELDRRRSTNWRSLFSYLDVL